MTFPWNDIVWPTVFAVAPGAVFIIVCLAARCWPRALDRAPGTCAWCDIAPLASLPSDCTCERPCADIACGARPVRKGEPSA